MASVRTTFTVSAELIERARKLGINVSEAARRGVADAVRAALIEADRHAYRRHPEQPDAFWSEAEAWGDE